MKPNLLVLFFILIFILTEITVQAQIRDPQELYDLILKKYDKLGYVKYKELCGDSRLAEYVGYLKSLDPEKLKPGSSELAFWINEYNAFTLKLVCDNYPIKSINDLNTGIGILRPLFGATVMDKKLVPFGKEMISLNDIVKKEIWTKFKDPRIYFALVFAAKDCPPLRDEPYEGDKISLQLNEQARLFLNDTTKNYFDVKNRKAYLSSIFQWHENDFGNNREEMLIYISRFLPKNISSDLIAFTKKWDIVYKDFNWSLNEAK